METHTDTDKKMSLGGKLRQKPKVSSCGEFFTVVLLVLGILFLSAITFSPLLTAIFSQSGPLASTAIHYVATPLANWMILLLFLVLSQPDREILYAFGPRTRGNNLLMLLAGLAVGAGMNGICALVAWLQGSITLQFVQFSLPAFLLLFVCVFIQSASEEAICRGFIYQRLRRAYKNPAVAIIGSALLFTLFHLMNPGVTMVSVLNIWLEGIFSGLLVYCFDSLWMAMAAHTAWNFLQSIVLGLPNSGIEVPYSVFKLDTATAANGFAYDIHFGLEAGLMAGLVELIGILLLIWLARRCAARREKV